jgi:tetratricopeptide (TPR) repeat protein
MGLVYESQGDYNNALDYYSKSLKLRQELADRAGEAASLNDVGKVYQSQGDHAKALDYFTKSIKLRQELGDRDG